MARLMNNIPSMEPFQIDHSTSTNLDKEWNTYKEEFDLFISASGITNDAQKLSLLLHLGGKQLREVYSTVKGDDDNFETAKTKLTTYFQPKKNTTYERFKFKGVKQEKGESNLRYITRLKSITNY